MMPDNTLQPETLIDGYLDDTLSAEESAALNLWLQASPEHARLFAQAMLLHDRLRSEMVARTVLAPDVLPVAPATAAPTRTPCISKLARSRRRERAVTAWAGVFFVGVVVIVLMGKGAGDAPASAAVVELNRIIAVNAKALDRTFQLTVEESMLGPHPGGKPTPEDGRPPKPPLDGAVLHVREGRQFVLARTAAAGLPFVTGSNGRTSWAVRPDGPVRVSTDLNRFNHDLPGHEQSLPLINIEEGLGRLREAYVIQLSPVEEPDGEIGSAKVSSRLLVAVKKPSYRGPRRVEITYVVDSGLIEQVRYVDMPYGPEHLTLRMTVIDERRQSEKFFDHQSHHGPERTVEFE